jgi:hypothetical protein
MYSREEKKELVKNFWKSFDEYCNKIPLLSLNKRKWILHKTKISNVTLKFEPGRENAKVILEAGESTLPNALLIQ